MSTDLKALRGALLARAEGDTDAEALLARIGPAYRRRRGRRIVGAATAAVAVAALVVMLVPRLLFGGYALPAPPSVPIPSPAAATIGADPRMVHFDVGEFPYRVMSTEWAVEDGVERLSMWGSTDDNPQGEGRKFFADLTLAAETWSATPNPTALPEAPRQPRSEPATVGGQPALVVTGGDSTSVTWSPIAGIRAELSVRGPVPTAKSVAFAGTFSLDRGHQCTPLLQPDVLPPGGHLAGCSIRSNGLGQYIIRSDNGTITVAIPTGVFDLGISPGAYPGAPPTLANGWPYQELDASANTQHWTAYIRVPDPWVEIWAQGTYGLPDVLLVGGGLRRS
ncbi:hypothetical protein AB0K00_56205 [Dactylosporangium sp. NPDC049525]|uniref:hypothetical protein n=1 Tax=Dactylosporangium sp. NPDC049525 TaxID=3154730 RepID=UPI00343572BD